MDIYLSCLIIFLFMVISAFFSVAETGLTALSRAKIHKLRMEGNKRAMLVTYLRHDKEKLLGSLLLGNNIVNIASSAIATSALIRLFGDQEGVLYATIIMTAVVLIFGEVMPKTYAFAHAEKVALFVAPLVAVSVKILSPITILVQKIVEYTYIILKINTSKQKESSSSALDLIRGTIDLHHYEGVVVKQDRDMLGSVLDLADTEVGEVMVHRKKMVTINLDQDINKIIEEVLDNAYTRLPVWKDNQDNIIGVLNTKDILNELHKSKGHPEAIDLKGILSDPWFIPSTITLKDQLLAFRENRNHFALVIDEYGSLMGLITLEDILEEIVGHINDEHDNVFIGIMKEADGAYVVDGTVTVRDLNRQLDWELTDDEAATVAGLLIAHAKIIPDPGEVFDIDGIRFEVLKRHKNQILYIRLKKI